jgi:hypothetical protein
VKHHVWIIVVIVVGFGSFMVGYSLPPFLEVGFGGGEAIESGVSADEELMKKYEELYKQPND